MSCNMEQNEFEKLKNKYMLEMQNLIKNNGPTQPYTLNSEFTHPEDIVDPDPSSNYDEFLQENQGEGTLKVKVTTAQSAMPMSNVRIVISKDIGNKETVFYSLFTDQSGIIDNMSLPAPIREYSDSPDSKFLPYTIYDISLYINETELPLKETVEIFDGVKSIKNVEVVPIV